MRQTKPRLDWAALFFSFVPASITTDFFFTLLRQPAEYWQDFSKAREDNSLIFPFLAIHPLFFVAGYLVYVSLVLWMFNISKLPFKIILATGLIFVYSIALYLHLGIGRSSLEIYYFLVSLMNLAVLLLLLTGLILWLFSKSKKGLAN